MFGWRDYREDGKRWVENGVENSVFHRLGSEGKKRGRKTREKIFVPGPPIFFLPNREKNCGEKTALTMELHKCPLPPTLLMNTMNVLESSKKKKKLEIESWRKKKERKHFLNEGEKERKEVGDKETRTNVYGGKKKKTKRVSWRKERENESAG